jgi:hypothetical protein
MNGERETYPLTVFRYYGREVVIYRTSRRKPGA